jgi:hypothetical protein
MRKGEGWTRRRRLDCLTLESRIVSHNHRALESILQLAKAVLKSDVVLVYQRSDYISSGKLRSIQSNVS